MSKAICPVRSCGQKYISKEHAERHADIAHPDWRIPKAKGWVTPHGFVDFSEPVTYEKACEVARQLSEKFNEVKP